MNEQNQGPEPGQSPQPLSAWPQPYPGQPYPGQPYPPYPERQLFVSPSLDGFPASESGVAGLRYESTVTQQPGSGAQVTPVGSGVWSGYQRQPSPAVPPGQVSAVPSGGLCPQPLRRQPVSSPTGSLVGGSLVIIVAGLLGLVVGGIGGIGAASVTSSLNWTSSRAPRSPFPGDVRYLPGLTMTKLRQEGGNGWKCTTESVPKSLHGVGLKLYCRDAVAYRSNVIAYSEDEIHVREVRGYCLEDASDLSRCATFYGDLATLVFGARPEESASPARSWTMANGRTEKQTTIDVVDIKASKNGVMSFSGVG